MRSAEELLAMLADRGGYIVRGGELGPMEVEFALRAGSAWVNAAGEAFVLRPRRVGPTPRCPDARDVLASVVFVAGDALSM